MIKISKNDSIVDILKKISEEKSNKIILSFPFGHSVLHNYLSLKIIQTKVGKKDLVIITNDKTSRRIGKLLGIKFSKLKSSIFGDEELLEQNILKQNYSFGEYALLEIKKIFGFVGGNISRSKKINSIQYYRNKHKHINKNIIMYFLLIFISIFIIFLYVFYFAINKTTIEIIPEISVKSKARNFTYKEKKPLDNDVLPLEGESSLIIPDDKYISLNKISKTVSVERVFSSSGIKGGNNKTGKGEVELVNLFEEDIQLLANTQFINTDGVSFYNKEIIKLPAATRDKNSGLIAGTVKTTLFGNTQLIDGSFAGDKANIGSGVILSIPKLGDDISKIFAKTITDFLGATNDYQRVLQQSDIDNGLMLLESNLKDEAKKAVKLELENKNTTNNISEKILGVDGIYKFSNFSSSIRNNLKAGDEVDSFTLNGFITLSTYSYNSQLIVSKLKKIINENTISDFEEVLKVDDSSNRISHIIKRNDLRYEDKKYRYIDTGETPLEIKATTEVEYYVSRNFGNTNNAYIERLKNTIAGMSIAEAETLLTNNPYINNVNINVSPFFLKEISKISDNIHFKVLD